MALIYVGQNVRCIQQYAPSKYNEKVPIMGNIYKIRSVVRLNKSGKLGLRFTQVHNVTRNYDDVGITECAFPSEGFKPINIEPFCKEVTNYFESLFKNQPNEENS